MQAPPAGLLVLSDKEFLSIFDALSTSFGILHPSAGPLSRTCRRLDVLYRHKYVTGYDSRLIQEFDEDIGIEESDIMRALLRLPQVTSFVIDVDLRYFLRSVHLVVQDRITEFTESAMALYMVCRGTKICSPSQASSRVSGN